MEEPDWDAIAKDSEVGGGVMGRGAVMKMMPWDPKSRRSGALAMKVNITFAISITFAIVQGNETCSNAPMNSS